MSTINMIKELASIPESIVSLSKMYGSWNFRFEAKDIAIKQSGQDPDYCVEHVYERVVAMSKKIAPELTIPLLSAPKDFEEIV